MPRPTPKPRWQEIVADALDGLDTGRAPRQSIAINFPPSMQSHVVEAAGIRGLSLSAFSRRAVMAVTAYDLELDWLSLMADEPRTRRFAQIDEEPERRAGLGHGSWRIVTMEEYRADS